ncbi:DUF2461 domain-containing protein [Fluviicola sp.]|jgi:uncharacterized protein (TIGR02453 family)|uniref:DUF2461 domain-containing protein n=1 Tax=Fluviicola sp. TaxID=1917219 RepID=UPI002827163C|nr:DUF2461 domain-containing protein [Fluviicola sp.]MDR0801030.1 DUF2461 domain-containing protein [Fluviicola sp.]
MAYFTKDYLNFFIELAANNHKEWFDANRKRYETSVKKPFAGFVQTFINHLAKSYPVFKDLTASECIFRINRDVRFSKDKTPYKLLCSAVVAPNGKKSRSIHGVYFEFGPEAVRVYGGIYEIDKDDLYTVREGIATNLKEFETLISDENFVQVFGEIRGERNKIAPKEFKAAAEKQPYILNKQWYFMTEFDSDLILQDYLLETIDSCFQAGLPLETFFNKFIQRP